MNLGLQLCQEKLKETPDDEFLQKINSHFHIFEEIFHANEGKWLKGCGSYLFDGQTYAYTPVMLEKQRAFYHACKGVQTCFEIGVYMAHSQLIMLMANPTMEIHSVDIDATYAEIGINVLKKHFPQASLHLTIAPSLSVMDTILQQKKQWDMFHIDGDHNFSVIAQEWQKCQPYVSTGSIVVFDDIDVNRPWFHSLPCISRITPDCKWSNMILHM